MLENVCHFFRERDIILTAADKELALALTRHKKLPKHSILMQQGKPVRRLYFLNSGIVRLFRIHNNNDYTLGLVSGREFVATPLYIQYEKPSSCALEALTDLDVLEWDRDALLSLKQNLSKAHIMEMALLDRLLTWVQDGQIDAICHTAEERYQRLMKEQPELIAQLPLKYIASYLNIHQDSLSRIRKAASGK